ncbi:hypothetical protein Plhal304r1_c044g0124831 [Plasmopara halstedii]
MNSLANTFGLYEDIFITDSGAVWVERTLRAHQELTHEYALNFEHSKLRPFAKQIVEWFIRVGNSG